VEDGMQWKMAVLQSLGVVPSIDPKSIILQPSPEPTTKYVSIEKKNKKRKKIASTRHTPHQQIVVDFDLMMQITLLSTMMSSLLFRAILATTSPISKNIKASLIQTRKLSRKISTTIPPVLTSTPELQTNLPIEENSRVVNQPTSGVFCVEVMHA
jgi:hypothetical protein